MRLRGITLEGEAYFFELNDCPVIINDTTIALVNKPGSPLLRANSIARSSVETGICETDFVMTKSNKFVGYIVYDNRFRIWLTGLNVTVPFDDVDKFIIQENTGTKDIEIMNQFRSPILYKYGDFTFNINKVIRIVNNKVIVYNKLLREIYVRDVNLCTGLTYNGIPIAFGETVPNGKVVLHHNKPMIKIGDDVYKEFEKGEYDD